MIERKYLAQPSIEDSRDFVATMIVPTATVFPETFKLSYSGEIKNQGQVGSCVAHSAAYCREIVEEKQSGSYKKFSVGFVYGNRESVDSQDEGMMPREMLKNLQKYGDVLYEDFPYNEEYPKVKARIQPIKANLYDKALPYKISAYAKLNNSDEIKSALMQLGPVTICIPVYQAYEELNVMNCVVPIPDVNREKCLGYHENTIVGWTVKDGKECWIDLNSWGPEWGNGGYCLIPFEFPIAEAWSITDNILPQSNPSPATHKFYRVQSKVYSTLQGAQTLLSKIKALGYNTAIVNGYNGGFVVQVASFTDKDRLRASNLLVNVKKQIPGCGFEIKYY